MSITNDVRQSLIDTTVHNFKTDCCLLAHAFLQAALVQYFEHAATSAQRSALPVINWGNYTRPPFQLRMVLPDR